MVYMFLANGFEEIEALCPLDLLRRAGIDVCTLSVGGGEWVQGSHGICVQADMPETMFRDARPEMIILPGGMPGAENLEASRTVGEALTAAGRSGGFLAAICAAPMVLGRRGYLEGKKATCFPGFEDELKGATVTDSRVVRDGNIITAKGMGVATEFGLALIEALRGKETADRIAAAVFAK